MDAPPDSQKCDHHHGKNEGGEDDREGGRH
jgi:hypothetical protein